MSSCRTNTASIPVFGAYGAITFTALSGVLLDRLRAATSPAAPLPPAPTKAIAQ
jgi:hypothetical protein